MAVGTGIGRAGARRSASVSIKQPNYEGTLATYYAAKYHNRRVDAIVRSARARPTRCDEVVDRSPPFVLVFPVGEVCVRISGMWRMARERSSLVPWCIAQTYNVPKVDDRECNSKEWSQPYNCVCQWGESKTP